MNDTERKRWLDDPRHVDRFVHIVYGVCALVGLVDIFSYKHHLHFAFEYWPGFYSVFGFVACVSLVLAAKQLRKVVKRDEDYYDR